MRCCGTVELVWNRLWEAGNTSADRSDKRAQTGLSGQTHGVTGLLFSRIVCGLQTTLVQTGLFLSKDLKNIVFRVMEGLQEETLQLLTARDQNDGHFCIVLTPRSSFSRRCGTRLLHVMKHNLNG